MSKAKKDTLKNRLTDDEITLRRADAFFEMENPLRDCADLSEIAATLLRSNRLDLCHDIILELEKKLLALKTNWLKEIDVNAK